MQVLHLESSELIRQMVKNLLEEKGYFYIPAESAYEAYAVLDTQTVDLIITSILIKEDTIEHFLSEINQGLNREVPIIVITGNDMTDDKKRIIDLGVSDYITKDRLTVDLVKRLENLKQQQFILDDVLKGSKIAIVDDSKMDRQVMELLLQEYGVSCVDAYESGRALFDSGKKYDLYLVDVVLNNEFGRNIVIELRRKNMYTTIVVVSSIKNSKTLVSLLDVGADDFIHKPIHSDLFIARLKANLRSRMLVEKLRKMLEKKSSSN